MRFVTFGISSSYKQGCKDALYVVKHALYMIKMPF